MLRHPTSRREFLQRTVCASAVLGCGGAPVLLGRGLDATPAGGVPALVVLELPGGNDGLNTVVPFADDAYHRARPTLRLAPDRVLRLNDEVGLHPDMAAFARLYHAGRLSVVQGVGYPQSQRDHPLAMRDWHTSMHRIAYGELQCEL